MRNYDICIQEHIIVATMVLHNFIKAHEDNVFGQGLSRRDTCESSEEVIMMKWQCDLIFR